MNGPVTLGVAVVGGLAFIGLFVCLNAVADWMIGRSIDRRTDETAAWDDWVEAMERDQR